MSETAKVTLEDYAPPELFKSGEYSDCESYKMKDVRVLCEHKRNWIGIQKNVFVWWELENGYAVAWNENPSRGWTFPLVRIKGRERQRRGWKRCI